MKIYNIQATIADVYRGDTSYRIFKYYKIKEKAEKEMKKLEDVWKKYQSCHAIFSIQEIEVVE